MEAKGILRSVSLPYGPFEALWDRIIVPEETKKRLVAQAALEFTMRGKLDPGAVPLHGIILLVGPPGTGKTTLAKAIASKVVSTTGMKKARFLEVDPHELTSSSLGKSQRSVRELLNSTIAEHAEAGPLIVLLDEVETLAVDRSKLSMEANPIDVHRATDAVLASMDHLAEKYTNILFIATSNFEEALDQAFISRADLVVYIDKPAREACEAILKDTLSELGKQWKKIAALADHRDIKRVAESLVGFDGRQIRKIVLSACALDVETAIDPSRLTIDHLKKAIDSAKKERK